MKKLFLVAMLLLTSVFAVAGEINLITDRSDFHIKPMVSSFEKETGIKVNVLYAEKGLYDRSKNGRFDVVITKDAMVLEKLKNKLAAFPNNELNVVDDKYGIVSSRVRGFFVRKGLKNVPFTYDDLLNPVFTKNICVRSFTHNYNIDLFSVMAVTKGMVYTKNYISKLHAQLAVNPSSNDRGQVKKIYEGKCDVSLGNSYYYDLMLENPEQTKWAEQVIFVEPINPIRLYSAIGMFNGNKETKAFVNYVSSKTTRKMLTSLTYEDMNTDNIGYSFAKMHQVRNELYNFIKSLK
jgi:iron(III) transport system substrate-binding protein